MSFFGSTLTVVVTLLHIYLYARLAPLLDGHRRITRKDVLNGVIIMWLFFFFGRMAGNLGLGFVSSFVALAATHWMATLFLLSVGLLAADLVCGFGKWLVPYLKPIRIAGLSLGLVLAIVAHVQGLRPPVVEQREMAIKGLPGALSGMKVAVVCDWHAGRMMVGGNWLSKRIDQVMAQKPDLILLNGDLFDQGTGPDEMIPAMRRLSAQYGVFAVRGNHEARLSKSRDVTGEILETVGIRLLQNEHLEVADGLLLAGIDDLTSSRIHPGEGDFNLDKALSGRPDKTTILMSHTPWMVDQARAAGVDLMLSGHTHNGQIWPFNYLVKLRYPYIVGAYDIRGMPLLVSRGTGTWGPRMRLWQRGEITLITLRSK